MIHWQGKMPMRFPRLEITEVTPANSPGVQVADLLLWHQRRLKARKGPRCRDLLKRAGLVGETSWTGDDSPMEYFEYSRRPPATVIQRPNPRPVEDRSSFASMVCAIERSVHGFACAPDVPDRLLHLLPRARAISATLDGSVHVDHQQLRELARVFLMLVDTEPLYDDQTAQDAADVIGIAVSVHDLRLAECIDRLGRWLEIRRLNPEHLGWLTRRAE